MNQPGREVEVVQDRRRAEVMLHPLRLRILRAAREPDSAAGLARSLGVTPQKVNYHVRRLSDHGFLRKTGERRAGNVVETVYQATAASYVLASRVLGELSPVAAESGSPTVGRLLALQARTESELGQMLGQGEEGTILGALTLDAEFRFETAEQRAVFTRAVRELFSAVVRKYTTPASTAGAPSSGGRPYRMVLGCYPIPEVSPGGEDSSAGGDPSPS